MFCILIFVLAIRRNLKIRSKKFSTPCLHMAKRSNSNTKQLDAFNIEDALRTAPCVPAIRIAVDTWRKGGYKGVTATTSELPNFWFRTDHILPNGWQFRYHLAQREAIETLIYLFEVAKVRSRTALLENYAQHSRDLRMPPYDEFARYCVKMATGSGKTMVLAMAVVWQYANAVREDETQ